MRLRGGQDGIGFMSLPELFASRDGEKLSGARGIISTLPEICHHIPTKRTDEAEMCRKILGTGFQLDDAELRNLLSSRDASTTALYRGFSKFMLEDLTTNKYTSHLSRSQLRKKSVKVAFEMIQVWIEKKKTSSLAGMHMILRRAVTEKPSLLQSGTDTVPIPRPTLYSRVSWGTLPL